MTASAETVLQQLRPWVAYCTGLPVASVIPALDKGPRPAMPYATIRITSDVAVGMGTPVQGLKLDPAVTTWAPGATKGAGAIVQPATFNGYRYTTAGGGTTGTAEPTWPTGVGSTVVDGTVTWTRSTAIAKVPYETTRGDRRATAQIDVFGHDASEALRACEVCIDLQAARDLLTSCAVARTLAPARDLSSLRDTAFESHWQQDYEISYAVTLTAQPTLTVCQRIDWDVTLDTSNPPADLHATGSEAI